jgi:sodium/proline symporter
VSWTDVVQALLMVLALIAVPLSVICGLGGPHTTLASVQRANPALLEALPDRDGTAMSVIGVASLLGWGLGYFGQPHILARFMAIARPEEIAPARRIAVAWSAIGMLGAVLVGISGVAFLADPLSGADTEKVFMALVALIFHPLVAGVLLAAILAAIMSTADSQLLVASSALSGDFYKGLWRRKAGQRELVWVGRGAVVAIAAIAYLIARTPDNKVLDLVAYAWAGFGAAFGPTILLSLYWRRMTGAGALAGILAGGLTVIVWKQLEGGLFDLYEIIPGFLLSGLAIVTVSLLTPKPADDITQRHDAVSRNGASPRP